MDYSGKHNTITFYPPLDPRDCPRCHRSKPLGKCEDGCEMCQSCYRQIHDMGALPSDTML